MMHIHARAEHFHATTHATQRQMLALNMSLEKKKTTRITTKSKQKHTQEWRNTHTYILTYLHTYIKH